MKKVVLIISMWSIAHWMCAQDQPTSNTHVHSGITQMTRTERDINVLEKVLEELLESEHIGSKSVFPQSKKVHGMYIPEFGVIFHLPPVLHQFTTIESPLFFDDKGRMELALEEKINIEEKKGRKRQALKDQQKDLKEEELKLKQRLKTLENQVKNIGMKSDSLLQAKKDKMKEIMTHFMVNYGDLMSELKADEKILLVYENPKSNFMFRLKFNDFSNSWNQDKSFKLTGEVKKSLIDDYKSGKLNKDQLASKIVFQEGNKAEDEKEFEILSGILESAISSELAQNKEVRFNRLDGFGVIYHLQASPSFKRVIGFQHPELLKEFRVHEDQDQRKMKIMIERDENVQIINKNGVLVEKKELKNNKPHQKKREIIVLEERENTIDDNEEGEEKEMIIMNKQNTDNIQFFGEMGSAALDYQKLKNQLKEYLITYGRTLRSLDTDEFLMLNLNLRHFSTEDHLPQNLILSVKKSVLDAYDQRKITLEEAIRQVHEK